MKKLLTAIVLTAVSLSAAAGIQSDIETIVDVGVEVFVENALPGRIADLEEELKLDRVEVSQARAELSKMSSSVNVPYTLYVIIIQKIEPGLYAAKHNGRTIIISSDRISGTGWFQQPLVRQKENLTMIMNSGFEKDFAHYVDIDMDPTEYMKKEYEKIGFYAERELYWEIRDALKVKEELLITLKGQL